MVGSLFTLGITVAIIIYFVKAADIMNGKCENPDCENCPFPMCKGKQMSKNKRM